MASVVFRLYTRQGQKRKVCACFAPRTIKVSWLVVLPSGIVNIGETKRGIKGSKMFPLVVDSGIIS